MNINELIAQLEGRRLEFKGELPTNVGDNVGDVGDVGNIDNNISYNKLKVIQLILHNPNITTKEIAETLGLSTQASVNVSSQNLNNPENYYAKVLQEPVTGRLITIKNIWKLLWI